MRRRAAAWTLARRVKDRVALNEPGKHHPIWDIEVELPNPKSTEITIDAADCPHWEELRLLADRLQPTPYGGLEDRAGFAALAKRVAA